MGYETLVERARAVAEIIELMTYHDDMLRKRKGVIPGYKVPPTLLKNIQARYTALGESEKSAVADLRRSTHGKTWREWVRQHLQLHPKDALRLFFLEQHFGGGVGSISSFIWKTYCEEGIERPWQMDHKW